MRAINSRWFDFWGLIFTGLSVAWHLPYRFWIDYRIAEGTIHWMGVAPVNAVSFFSAIFAPLNVRWLSRVLILLNLLAISSNWFSLYHFCNEMRSSSAFLGCYYLSGEMNTSVLWDTSFWALQLGLILFLVVREVRTFRQSRKFGL